MPPEPGQGPDLLVMAAVLVATCYHQASEHTPAMELLNGSCDWLPPMVAARHLKLPKMHCPGPQIYEVKKFVLKTICQKSEKGLQSH